MNMNHSFKTLAATLLLSMASISMTAYAEDPAAASDPAAMMTTADTAAAPATATTPVPPPQATAEHVGNPYGLQAIWNEGDFVSKGTLIIMLLMSAGTWFILFTKLMEQMKLKKQAKLAQQSFKQAATLDQGISTLPKDSAFHYMADTSYTAAKRYNESMVNKIDYNSWVLTNLQRATDTIQSRMSRGLAFLATVGSTAPFIGLFGTVWGIYHALTAIGVSGQASIDKVAGPVGEALIMTAVGLAVAVPAVLGYNWLVRRNKAVLEDIRNFSGDVHAAILSGQMQNKPMTPSSAAVKNEG